MGQRLRGAVSHTQKLHLSNLDLILLYLKERIENYPKNRIENYPKKRIENYPAHMAMAKDLGSIYAHIYELLMSKFGHNSVG